MSSKNNNLHEPRRASRRITSPPLLFSIVGWIYLYRMHPSMRFRDALIHPIKRLKPRQTAIRFKATTRDMGDFVSIVEVGPRDGLQNEKKILTVEDRVQFIKKLLDSGLSSVEVGSFVSPKWVPQMANSELVYKNVAGYTDKARLPILIPNMKGFSLCAENNVKDIAIFGSASETFSQKNINCSIEESMRHFKQICTAAKEHNIWTRGYISCIFACPYEGPIDESIVRKLVDGFMEMGCDEISLGDTIGKGTPGQMKRLIQLLVKDVPISKVAVHCHDTYGQALANIWAAVQEGVRIVDASVAGLGGCPYAKGATGNVATEDVVYMLHGSGFQTGLDLEKLGLASDYILSLINHKTNSRVDRLRSKST